MSKRKARPRQGNPAARALASGTCRPRIVKPKRGKGSYTRKPKGAGRGGLPPRPDRPAHFSARSTFITRQP